MEKKSKLKKISNIVLSVLVYLFLALCVITLVMTLVAKRDVDGAVDVFGHKLLIVQTDSMDKCELTDVSGYEIKSIPAGSVVVVEAVPTDPVKLEEWYRNEVQENDVLTFRYVFDNQKTVTHRVTTKRENSTGGFTFSLEGDNKNSKDGQGVQVINTAQENSPNYIIGKVTGTLPLLGYVLSVLKNPIGMIFTVMVPCFIIILLEIMKIVNVLSEEKKKKVLEEQEQKNSEIEELRRKLEALEQKSLVAETADEEQNATPTAPIAEAATAEAPTESPTEKEDGEVAPTEAPTEKEDGEVAPIEAPKAEEDSVPVQTDTEESVASEEEGEKNE